VGNWISAIILGLLIASVLFFYTYQLADLDSRVSRLEELYATPHD